MDNKLVGATAASLAVAMYSNNAAAKTTASVVAAVLFVRSIEPWLAQKGTNG